MIVKQQPDISQSQSDEGGPETHSGIVCDTLVAAVYDHTLLIN